MANWLDYRNQRAVRNQPLDPRLVNALGFLPELGVTMQVFSGGQDASGPRRTGSHRHDHGQAGDVFFYKDGRRLDWNNPKDVPLYQEIVKRAKANGVTGFGAGEGYMQPGSMHLGYGKPAVWGAGGKGANAPGWLASAYNGGGVQQASYSPSQTEQPMPKPTSVSALPTSVSRPAPQPGLGSPMMPGGMAPQAPQMNAGVNPIQGAPGTPPGRGMGLAGLFGGIKPGGMGNMAQALMGGASALGGMGGGQQQMAPANFVVPAAEPGMLDPSPRGGTDPRMAALIRLLSQNA